MTLPYRVLIAGSRSAADVPLTQGLFPSHCTIYDACGKGDAVHIAGNLKPDLIVLYDLMPQGRELESMKRIKKSPDTEDIPVVLIVPDGNAEPVIRGLDAGADDCLPRSEDPRELLARIRAVMRKIDAAREFRSRMEALYLHATTDRLTGLYNRQFLKPFIERSLASFKRYNRHYSLVMIEIDNLMSIYESNGRFSGDDVLKELGHLVEGRLRAGDLAVRYDHDTLIVLLSDTAADGSFPVAERLRKLVEEHPFPGITSPRVTASIGITEFEREDAGMDDIIGRAGEALAVARNEGKNRVRRL